MWEKENKKDKQMPLRDRKRPGPLLTEHLLLHALLRTKRITLS